MADTPQISPDGLWFWTGSEWKSLLSGDGSKRWDGHAWMPTALAPSPSESSTLGVAPAAIPEARAGTPDLNLEELPSWLPAESARTVMGNLPAPAPLEPASPAGAPHYNLQQPGETASTWAQQTYQSGAPARSNMTRYIAGIAAVLVLAVAGGAGYLYQQSMATAPPFDYAQMPAAGLMDHARLEMKSAGSYHLMGTAGPITQEITVASAHDASFDIRTPAGTVSMLLSGGNQFLKAPAAFYADKNPVLARNAADQWIVVPAAESLVPVMSVVNLDKTSQCILGRPGTLKKVGVTTVEGQSVIEIDDKGEIAGGTPAQFYFTRDGGVLMGIDIVAASTSGGKDPTCDGGLGLLTPTFTTVDKLRFDHWASVLDIRMPGGIDLTSKPWCGTIIGHGLSAEVQQFLLASYTINQKLATIEANCGCSSWSFLVFTQSATDEMNAKDAMANSVAALSLTGQAKSDANAFVTAQRAETAVMRRGLATGSFDGWNSVQAERNADDQANGAAITKLRADLGLGPGTCNFLIA